MARSSQPVRSRGTRARATLPAEELHTFAILDDLMVDKCYELCTGGQPRPLLHERACPWADPPEFDLQQPIDRIWQEPEVCRQELQQMCIEYIETHQKRQVNDAVLAWLPAKYAEIASPGSTLDVRLDVDDTGLTYRIRNAVSKGSTIRGVENLRFSLLDGATHHNDIGMPEFSRFLEWDKREEKIEGVWLGPLRILRIGCEKCKNCTYVTKPPPKYESSGYDFPGSIFVQTLKALRTLRVGEELWAEPCGYDSQCECRLPATELVKSEEEETIYVTTAVAPSDKATNRPSKRQRRTEEEGQKKRRIKRPKVAPVPPTPPPPNQTSRLSQSTTLLTPRPTPSKTPSTIPTAGTLPLYPVSDREIPIPPSLLCYGTTTLKKPKEAALPVPSSPPAFVFRPAPSPPLTGHSDGSTPTSIEEKLGLTVPAAQPLGDSHPRLVESTLVAAPSLAHSDDRLRALDSHDRTLDCPSSPSSAMLQLLVEHFGSDDDDGDTDIHVTYTTTVDTDGQCSHDPSRECASFGEEPHRSGVVTSRMDHDDICDDLNYDHNDEVEQRKHKNLYSELHSVYEAYTALSFWVKCHDCTRGGSPPPIVSLQCPHLDQYLYRVDAPTPTRPANALAPLDKAEESFVRGTGLRQGSSTLRDYPDWTRSLALISGSDGAAAADLERILAGIISQGGSSWPRLDGDHRRGRDASVKGGGQGTQRICTAELAERDEIIAQLRRQVAALESENAELRSGMACEQ